MLSEAKRQLVAESLESVGGSKSCLMTPTDSPVEGEATRGLQAIRQSVEQPDQSAFSNVAQVLGKEITA